MELCLLNWVEAGGRACNGAPVKMNENKGRRGAACCREAQSHEKPPELCCDPMAVILYTKTDQLSQTCGTRILRKWSIGIVSFFPYLGRNPKGLIISVVDYCQCTENNSIIVNDSMV